MHFFQLIDLRAPPQNPLEGLFDGLLGGANGPSPAQKAAAEEATKNARIAAEQFSRDSQTTLGKLRNATQGWFQVENRDAATPERKVVRVVVDVEYEIN